MGLKETAIKAAISFLLGDLQKNGANSILGKMLSSLQNMFTDDIKVDDVNVDDVDISDEDIAGFEFEEEELGNEHIIDSVRQKY